MIYLIIILSWMMGVLLFWRVRPLKMRHEIQNSLPPVSIIIPARNEEKNLGKLLRSLVTQCAPQDEVIVVDDDSSDATTEVTLKYGFRTVGLSGNPPAGWMGKSWACWNGYLSARNGVLLFLDADVELASGGVELLKAEHAKSGGLYSVQPYHRTERFYEKFSLFFNMLVVASIGSFGFWRRKPIGSFGPCMICSKQDYESVGGHQAIRNTVLDDVELARSFMKKRLPVHNELGGNVIGFRMYPDGLRDVILGWGKNFAAGAGKTHIIDLLMVVFWIAGALSAVLWPPVIAASFLSVGTLLYPLFAVQIWYYSRKLGNFGILSALMYPFFVLFFFMVFSFSLVRRFFYRSVIWKERKIDVSA